MHCRDRASREASSQRVVQNVHVKVQDIELLGHPADLVEHDEMIGNRIVHARIETQRLFAADFKSSTGD
jgi:hypothetical protein